MPLLTEETPKTGEQYRFIVRSADEAVRILRERLGDNARVVSVRQVEGAGLARFLRAPKLEVIAEVIGGESATEFPDVAESPENIELPIPEEIELPPTPIALDQETTPNTEGEVASDPPEKTADEELVRLLARGGLPAVMLATLRSKPAWLAIAELPLSMALNEITLLLREEYHRQPRRALTQRVAFLGAAGAGKTTALCKWLAADVFVRRHQAAVLKVDLDRANPGDGLAVFCEALGVSLSRTVEDLPALLPNEKTYIDLPGIGLGDGEEIKQYSKALKELKATSRVLVINAAYEASIIRQFYEAGDRLGATHVVFTHLDELTQWGKLWEFILGHDLTPLFLSSGQSIAGDFVEEVFPSVLARTFGTAGADIAKSKSLL
jgi:flagellar biosynthesis protein FlhF